MELTQGDIVWLSRIDPIMTEQDFEKLLIGKSQNTTIPYMQKAKSLINRGLLTRGTDRRKVSGQKQIIGGTYNSEKGVLGRIFLLENEDKITLLWQGPNDQFRPNYMKIRDELFGKIQYKLYGRATKSGRATNKNNLKKKAPTQKVSHELTGEQYVDTIRKDEDMNSDNYTNEDFENGYEEGQEYEIPVAERKIITQPSEPTINSLVDKIDKGKLEVRSFFQRKYVWEQQPIIKSRLIESVILNVPIPIIYTAEDENTGKELVIDGQQRLLTFHGFKNNQFKLKGLTILKELNGYKFKDLSNKNDPNIKEMSDKLGDLQDNFCDRPLRVVKILKESHPDIKFEIFERLNRGSVKLNDQELRNCIYRGNFNNLLKELAENNDFLRLQGLKRAHTRMLDIERILRFFAFCDRGERNYKSPLKKFLNDYMLLKQNISEAELNEKRNLFKRCVEMCQTVFGNAAYKRVFAGKDEITSGYIDKSLNQGIFDIHMCGFMDYSKHDIIPRSQAIKEAFLELVTSNDKFIETIEIGTYGTAQVKLRMEVWVNALRGVMGIPKDDKRLFTFEQKKRLFDQNNICGLCGHQITYIEDAHVDHIERYSQGGETSLSNARLTHRYCNLKNH